MKNGKRYITVCTDASLDQTYNCGGWACYIKFDEFTIRKAGSFINCPGNSTDAEAKAIGNALHLILIEKRIIYCPDIFVINCDNKGVKNYIENRTEGRKIKELLQRIKAYLNDPEISFRHVKGHTSGKTARTYINNWCDKEAGRHMRERRKLIQSL